MEAFAAERAVVVQGLRMDFRVGGEAFTVLDIPEFDVLAQSATALVGPSGSGKTTLLNIITGILTPTEGRVVVDGVELRGLSAGQRDRFRAERVGYVFQTFNLIPPLTALENVLLPMTFSSRIPRAEQRARAQGLLERVGLGHRMHHRPPQLSHGEQQRVGIARALANRPQLIVADEPTASLEPGSAEAVVLFTVPGVSGMRKAFAMGIALVGVLALVMLGEGAIRIRFLDFFSNKETYQAGIGMEPKLQLAPKLQELHGQEVELFGFMDSALPPDGSFFLILKEPLDVCPFHAYAFDWAAIATVFTQKGGTPYLGGPIKVIGRLDVGRRRDETGLISYVRIYDAKVMRAS